MTRLTRFHPHHVLTLNVAVCFMLFDQHVQLFLCCSFSADNFSDGLWWEGLLRRGRNQTKFLSAARVFPQSPFCMSKALARLNFAQGIYVCVVCVCVFAVSNKKKSKTSSIYTVTCKIVRTAAAFSRFITLKQTCVLLGIYVNRLLRSNGYFPL